jgi:cytochrome b561
MSDATNEAEYQLVAKVLHWTMFVFLAAQFVLGYAIDREDDLLEWVVDAWLAGEEEQLLGVHAGLGLALLLLAILRELWRSAAGLPPWAPGLSDRERRVVPYVERILYGTMFLIPLTGLTLVLFSGEDWNVGAQGWRAPFDWVVADLRAVPPDLDTALTTALRAALDGA